MKLPEQLRKYLRGAPGPEPGDMANGTSIVLPDDPTIDFSIRTWTGYSAGTGEYSAVETQWHIQPPAIQLIHLDIYRPYQGWTRIDRGSLVPDRHLRLTRAIGRATFGVDRFQELKIRGN